MIWECLRYMKHNSTSVIGNALLQIIKNYKAILARPDSKKKKKTSNFSKPITELFFHFSNFFHNALLWMAIISVVVAKF